jgi:hypothetical protein
LSHKSFAKIAADFLYQLYKELHKTTLPFARPFFSIFTGISPTSVTSTGFIAFPYSSKATGKPSDFEVKIHISACSIYFEYHFCYHTKRPTL